MAGLPANISYHSTYITLELCWLIKDLYAANISGIRWIRDSMKL